MDVEDEFHSSQIYNNKYQRLISNDDEHDDNNEADDTTPKAVAVAVEEPHQQLADSMFRGWHNSSRIFRVSRASGGKDRHSKVLTSKGLRDRRVRLSVSTAIQFYDLQDRLGYDQPSKAVEWLIKAAADSIAELPSLHGPFPDTPTHHLCDDAKLGFVESSAEQQHQKNSKSASSNSETSKGSGLSLTRTDVRVNQRVKARERARERAKEKECESEHAVNACQRRRQTVAANPNNTSSTTFTELLTGGNQNGSSPNNPTPMMDYFTNARSHAAACLFLGQTQMGNSINNILPSFHLTTGEPHHQHDHVQHFSFGQESLIPSGNNDQYDLNFTISSSSPSGLAAGFNDRGTLQSNSPSMLHHNLQRYAASVEGSNVPAFFMTTTAASSSMDNTNNHFPTGLDGGLHLYYGDHKDKGKN